MENTKKSLEKKNEKSSGSLGAGTRFLASTQKSEVATKTESIGLSKNLANSLMDLIDKVNADGVTPETVNASCNAAAQIYKILRLNYDMKKDGF